MGVNEGLDSPLCIQRLATMVQLMGEQRKHMSAVWRQAVTDTDFA